MVERLVAMSIAASLLFAGPAFGAGWEELCKAGYAVITETSVDGEFTGCEYDKKVPLQNGLVFVCSEYNYTYSYNPDVYILKNIKTGDIKVVIDDESFEGTLYRR